MKNKNILKRFKRKKSIRKKISGSPDKPRMTVFRSNKHIYAQVIDDVAGVTLVSASTMDKDFKAEGDKKAVATVVGETLAMRCREKGITSVVFDRNGFLYHGRVKALADGARKGGMLF